MTAQPAYVAPFVAAGLVLGAPALADDARAGDIRKLEACLLAEGAVAPCIGVVEAVCLADTARFSHAPSPVQRREWCVRAETAAMVELTDIGARAPGDDECADALGSEAPAPLDWLDQAMCMRAAAAGRLAQYPQKVMR